MATTRVVVAVVLGGVLGAEVVGVGPVTWAASTAFSWACCWAAIWACWAATSWTRRPLTWARVWRVTASACCDGLVGCGQRHDGGVGIGLGAAEGGLLDLELGLGRPGRGDDIGLVVRSQVEVPLLDGQIIVTGEGIQPGSRHVAPVHVGGDGLAGQRGVGPVGGALGGRHLEVGGGQGGVDLIGVNPGPVELLGQDLFGLAFVVDAVGQDGRLGLGVADGVAGCGGDDDQRHPQQGRKEAGHDATSKQPRSPVQDRRAWSHGLTR